MPTTRARRTARSGLALAGTLAAGAVTAAPALAGTAGACGPVDVEPRTSGVAAAEAAVGCLVDRERAAAGLGPLGDSSILQAGARAYSTDMVTRGFFGHVAPGPGGSLLERMVARGYPAGRVGENIATGQRTPAEVVAAWIRSEGHCRNLLSPAYVEDGVGVDLGGTSGSRGPTWTHHFGTPRGTTAAAGPTAACPRGPLPAEADVPAAAPPPLAATPTPAPVVTAPLASPPTPTAASAPDPRLRLAARREGRTLRVTTRLRGATAARRVRVDVRQSGSRRRAVRRVAPGARVAVRVRLRRASGGRVVVRAAGARAVAVRFR